MKLCSKCGKFARFHKNKARKNGTQPYCVDCNGSGSNRRYAKYKKDKCEKCNFVPIRGCQLDVDHIDGNHTNNNIDNLQTLCSNCHRLKSYLQDCARIEK